MENDEEHAKAQISKFPERRAVAFVNDLQGLTPKVQHQFVSVRGDINLDVGSGGDT